MNDSDLAAGAGRGDVGIAARPVAREIAEDLATAAKAVGHHLHCGEADRADTQRLQRRRAAEPAASLPAGAVVDPAAKAVGADDGVAVEGAATRDRAQNADPRGAARAVPGGEFTRAAAETIGIDHSVAVDLDRNALQVDLDRAALAIAAVAGGGEFSPAETAGTVRTGGKAGSGEAAAEAAKQSGIPAGAEPAIGTLAAESAGIEFDQIGGHRPGAHGQEGIAAQRVAAVAGGEIADRKAAAAG